LKIETSDDLEVSNEEVEVHGLPDCGDPEGRRGITVAKIRLKNGTLSAVEQQILQRLTFR